MEDEPVIKPRRARGTPFLKFRHRLAVGIAAVGFVAHCITVYFKKEEIQRKFAVGWYDETTYAKDKKAEFRSSLPHVRARRSIQHEINIEENLNEMDSAESSLESDLGD